jgi:hypothetical protein
MSDEPTPSAVRCPFAFTGELNKLTVEVGPMQLEAKEKKETQKKIGERD